MNTIEIINRAIEYAESNLLSALSAQQLASQSFYSASHFQRMFGMVCGLPYGEYIRKRKMSVAAEMIARTQARIDDIAALFGYESVEAFTKAFSRFHGITPRAAREPGAVRRSFSRIRIAMVLEGGHSMEYRIEQGSFPVLFGYCTSLQGDAADRFPQVEAFWERSRDRQNELIPHMDEPVWYDVNLNFRPDGYDHYIAVRSEEPIDGYDRLDVPEGTYAVFQTDRMKYPTGQLPDLRRRIATEWFPSSGYQLSDRPEITVTHWLRAPHKEERFIEVWIPVCALEKKT